MKHAAVLFDLDGTLADTLQDLAESMNAALACMGRARHPVAAYRQFVGNGIRVLCQRVLGGDPPDETRIEKLLPLMRREYAARQFDHTVLYPGIAALLRGLRERGVRRAVLSNKPHALTVEMVERLCGVDTFDLVQGHVEARPLKPDPAGALHVAEALGLAPQAFVFLGDTDVDMQTARAAGMFPVGALWGFRDRTELRASGAQAVIEHPGELLDLL